MGWQMPLGQDFPLPMHSPAEQWSLVVQALESLQVVPSATGSCLQVPNTGLQVSVVHGLRSSQWELNMHSTHS